jgi:hypothetical protein
MSDHRCNTCEYAGSIPGNAHTTCNSPVFKTENDKFVLFMAIVGGTPVGPRFEYNAFIQGWANWPVDFDPVWMIGGCGLHSSLKK